MSFPDLSRALEWHPPGNPVTIKTIDAHTGGEPLRIIVGGYPQLEGKTMLEKRRHALEHYDHLRKALMWEPRGHADMYGCLITPPVTDEAHFGVLFMHNEGYSSMCGHGIIAVVKTLLETGMMPITGVQTPVCIDTPAGLVRAVAHGSGKSVEEVSFLNVASFVQAHDQIVEVPGMGKVKYDLAFGGAFYAYVCADDYGIAMTPQNYRELIEKGMAIKRAVWNTMTPKHPFENDLNFLYGTIFTGSPMSEGADSRNVCIFADGEVDRSPTGTGVSGRMALQFSRGKLGIGEAMVIESILGTTFRAEVAETRKFGNYDAVIPKVGGRAWITGRHEFFIDPNDPLKQGFILR